VTGLVIAGAVCEFFGLMLVFIELAVIRSHEFGTPPPWAELVGWLRRVLKRPRIVELGVAIEVSSAMSVRGKVRPTPLSGGATAQERIAWLENYVGRLDEDVESVWREMREQESKLGAEAARRDAELRAEQEQREADRRDKLKPSLRRQFIGAVLVALGLILGTLGSVL
jgi:hypothetical protein